MMIALFVGVVVFLVVFVVGLRAVRPRQTPVDKAEVYRNMRKRAEENDEIWSHYL